MQPAYNAMIAGVVATFGSPGFLTPRVPPPFFAVGGGPEATSFYNTTPLRRTLEELFDDSYDPGPHTQRDRTSGLAILDAGFLYISMAARVDLGPCLDLASAPRSRFNLIEHCPSGRIPFRTG